MKATRKDWTKEEAALALRMLEEGATDAEFRARLGRSKSCVRAKRDRELSAYFRWSAAGNQPSRITLSAEVLADRARRALAPRSLTAVLMGDPPLFRSALGKKMGMSR